MIYDRLPLRLKYVIITIDIVAFLVKTFELIKRILGDNLMAKKEIMKEKDDAQNVIAKGRPRTFDRQAALVKALTVFWNRGYEPASMSELCSEMGITPPSLYAAFGNKASLFMEAVHYYENTYWDKVWNYLETEPDFHKGVMGFFKQAAQVLTSQDVPCGCLVILAATNISEEGQKVNDDLKALRKEGRNCFLVRIKKAIKEKAIPSDTDAPTLAIALNTMLEGMSLSARDGASRKELEKVAGTVIKLLP